PGLLSSALTAPFFLAETIPLSLCAAPPRSTTPHAPPPHAFVALTPEPAPGPAQRRLPRGFREPFIVLHQDGRSPAALSIVLLPFIHRRVCSCPVEEVPSRSSSCSSSSPSSPSSSASCCPRCRR